MVVSFYFIVMGFPQMEHLAFILALIFDICKKIRPVFLDMLYSVPFVLHIIKTKTAVHTFRVIQVDLIALRRDTVRIPSEISILLQRYIHQLSGHHIGLCNFTVCRYVSYRTDQNRAQTQNRIPPTGK